MIETRTPAEVRPIMHELVRGMNLKKCRKCGCMKEALDSALKAFSQSEIGEVRKLLPVITNMQQRMEPIAYDCIGCKKCWGADATIRLAERFEDVAQSLGTGCGPTPENLPVVRKAETQTLRWPPYPGDYIVGQAQGSVAICTLSSRELPASIMAKGEPQIAIAGRCDTENIGVEKVVLNLLANDRVRSLVLCGYEAQGHRTGDAFLHLKEKGVDPNMRVLESASWRPILKNLTLMDVARFREQIEVINLVGETDSEKILETTRRAASTPVSPLGVYNEEKLAFERIVARAPDHLKLDPAGFFIVLPQSESGILLCEHYGNNGRLLHVIEGRQAALIAATVVEKGLLTRLDHAVYLGRELAKAETALKHGLLYEQDAALGILETEEENLPEQSSCPDTKTGGCQCH